MAMLSHIFHWYMSMYEFNFEQIINYGLNIFLFSISLYGFKLNFSEDAEAHTLHEYGFSIICVQC